MYPLIIPALRYSPPIASLPSPSDHLQHQSNNDEDIARRLQSEFDNKALEEQRDQEMARQLQQQNNPPPPPLHQPHPLHPPPPVVPGDAPEIPADNDAALALRLQETEMNFNQRIYKSGQIPGYGTSSSSSPSSYLGLTDEALARQLQERELASKYHQEGYNNTPQQETIASHPAVSDEDYARQLQSSSDDFHHTNPHYPSSSSSFQQPLLPLYNPHYPQATPSHSDPPHTRDEEEEEEEEQEGTTRESDVTPPRNLTDQDKDVQGSLPRPHHHHHHNESDAELALRLQVQEEEEEEEEKKKRYTTSPAAAVAAVDRLCSDGTTASSGVVVAQADSHSARQELYPSSGTGYGNGYHDYEKEEEEEDQPKSKHQPTSHAHMPGGHTHPADLADEEMVVNIPCQYCGKPFPKQTIMYHQVSQQFGIFMQT